MALPPTTWTRHQVAWQYRTLLSVMLTVICYRMTNRISDIFMDLPGARYIVQNLKLQEAWGWIVTQGMTTILGVFARDQQHLQKVQ